MTSDSIDLRKTTRKNAKTLDRVLVHESRHIPYRLHLGKRRGLRISVTPGLVVNVFAPSHAPRTWVDEAIRERAPWIVRTIDKVAAREILVFPETFEAGSILQYLGCEYRLAIVGGRPARPELLFDALVVTARDPADSAGITRAVKRWYRLSAEARLEEAIERCLTRLERYGANKPAVTIRNMRSRWGSCSSGGRVTLNLKLVMLPQALIDYVVMHELCHLIHHNHGKRYYVLLTGCMPDWQDRKHELDRYRMIQ